MSSTNVTFREKKDAEASFLPSYYYSPRKDGRKEEEAETLRKAEELEIPDGVEEIGNYTFYGCFGMKKLKFTDSLKRIGGGSFTGCSALRRLEVKMKKGGRSCIRDVVAETFHEVYVKIVYRETGEEVHVIFPEYYEEGVENTPARILETHFHGTGYRYRQCFKDKKLDLHEYDGLFELATANEKEEILIEMALGRLLFPSELTKQADLHYTAYLKQRLQKICTMYLKEECWAGILAFLMDHIVTEKEEADLLLDAAANGKHTEAVSFLMEEKRRKFGRTVKSFEF